MIEWRRAGNISHGRECPFRAIRQCVAEVVALVATTVISEEAGGLISRAAKRSEERVVPMELLRRDFEAAEGRCIP